MISNIAERKFKSLGKRKRKLGGYWGESLASDRFMRCGRGRLSLIWRRLGLVRRNSKINSNINGNYHILSQTDRILANLAKNPLLVLQLQNPPRDPTLEKMVYRLQPPQSVQRVSNRSRTLHPPKNRHKSIPNFNTIIGMYNCRK